MSNKTDSAKNPKTLSEALKELEQESKASLSGQLDALRQTLTELEPKITAVAKSAVVESSEHVKKAKDELGKRVEKHPLLAIGIVAALLLLVGWLYSSSKDSKESKDS